MFWDKKIATPILASVYRTLGTRFKSAPRHKPKRARS